ncbi:MAG: tRNA1(Val) (adenine(37)-N6)-methyltransferase [Rhodospirillaceae bacterium]
MDQNALSEDGLLDGRLRLLQPAAGYRAAIDPVLLAAAARAAAGGRALDLGCGTGAAALCLAARRPDLRVCGVEMQPEYAALARRSAAINAMAERVSVAEGDAANPATWPAGWEGFDAALANPPFFTGGSRAPDAGRAAAHHADAADLAAWIAAARHALAPRGSLTLILPAARLGEALALLARGFGAAQAIPLWPKPGRAAKRVILRAEKGRRTPFALLPGLALHGADGSYTAAAARILRGMESLDAVLDSAEEGGC